MGAPDRHTIGDVEHAGAAIPEEHAARPVEQAAEATRAGSYGQVLQGISAVVAPATLLGGIAFYFGWQRVRAFDAYFGLNPGAVGYSTRDYVLNSLNALFLPVMVVLLGVIALALAHAYVGRVHRSGRRPHTLRWLSELGLWIGALLLVGGGLGAFGAFPFHTPYLIATLLPAAGVLLLAHAVDLRARLRGDPPISPAGRVFVGLFVAVCLFWAAGFYAGTVGRDQARALARHLDELPGVTMSGTTSGLAGAGGESATGGGIAGTRSRGSRGFRLLTVANGKLFLLPDGWKARRGKLYAVDEADAKGLAFTPGTVHGSSAVNSAVAGGPPVSGGCSPPAACVVRGSVHRVGALAVRVDAAGERALAVLVNRTDRPVRGVSLTGTLAKNLQPFVVGAASCRVGRGRFTCGLDPIPPRSTLKLRITYRANAYVKGTLLVRVGSAHESLPFVLSRD